MAAPPIPCTARAMFRNVASGASPAASDAAANSPSPAANTARRPMRSATEPAVSTIAASESVYASITHWRSVKLAERSFWIEGSAVLTTVMSKRSMKVATLTAIRVHHFVATGTTSVFAARLVRKPGKASRLFGHLIRSPDEMASDSSTTSHQPFIRLLNVALDEFTAEFSDIRVTHGCVFGNIDPEGGTRLTELAERACMTKQSVGEVASDLEERGYLERVPDPADGRAKIIRLTERGRAAYAVGRGLIDNLEREWGERYGEERIAALRESLELVTAQRLGLGPAR